MSIEAVDLFAGAGGLSLGLEEAGIKTAYAVEVDQNRAQTFSRRMPETDLFCSDVRDFDLRAVRNKVDVVCGGPPCQPFSTGGLRAADKDERNMIPWFVKAVDIVRPGAFLMENVPGLVSGNRAGYFGRVLEELEALGYTMSWRVLNAADFGVPQNRRRLFAVGLKGQRFVFPEPTHGLGRKLPHVSVDDVLPYRQLGEPNRAIVTYARKPDLRPNPYHGQLFNGGGRPVDKNMPAPTLLASAGGNKTHFFDDHDLVPEYHRHLLAGGRPREGRLEGARRLTVMESAILQTFPNDMEFSGSSSAQYQQVGNAVPPKLAAVLGRALVSQLLAEPDEEKHDLYWHSPQGSLFESRELYNFALDH